MSSCLKAYLNKPYIFYWRIRLKIQIFTAHKKFTFMDSKKKYMMRKIPEIFNLNVTNTLKVFY